ncbi:MAG: hypothetical protein RJB66_1696 [Pseudomonadota bacterium]|jgi:hypothetical protein
MKTYSCFLSVVLVVRNSEALLRPMLAEVGQLVEPLVQDYEIVVVDNASTDASVEVLKDLTKENGLPNLQIYALTKEVDTDTASWVGLENALGDLVVVLDPFRDSIRLLPTMLDSSASGRDVVFAKNTIQEQNGLMYNLCQSLFNVLYRWASGLNLAAEAPQYRIVSRRVINYILQHSMPALAYKYLPATGGFSKQYIQYEFVADTKKEKNLFDSIERGIKLLVSTTRGPMRIVTGLSLFGAISNLCYSVYVLGVAFFKTNIAPGWVTLSLQQSGMFFLISMVLLVLGEYILHMSSLTNEAPPYYVGQEFTSAVVRRRKKLNIEVVGQPEQTQK